MGTCAATFRGDPDGEVSWYTANSETSLQWQNKPTGFGYKKNQSFRQRALRFDSYNRPGNENGELAGRLVFYQLADHDTNYHDIPEEQSFRFKDGDKLFAKAFLNVPLGRTPIGENNIIPCDEPRAQGATLLGSRPRVIAIFLDVDGEPQTQEHFCEISKSNYDSELELNEINPKPRTLDKAMPGSFCTFMSSTDLEQFGFLHLPLVGTLRDVSFKSGLYAETLVKCFCELLATLTPGKHKFDLSIKYWYDHCDYNCFVLGNGTNVLSRWYQRIPNERFKCPHENPEVLVCPDEPIAKGSVTLDIVTPYEKTVLRHMDRKPPPEKYRKSDAEELRKIAQTVAAGRFSDQFGLCGLPDWVVLTSPIKTRVVTTQESLSGKHKYEALDYAALWFNEADGRRPDATGTMVEGSMARGEITLGHDQDDWVWAPSIRNGDVIPTRRRPIKNKYIAEAERSSRNGPRLSIWAKLKELYNMGNEDEDGSDKENSENNKDKDQKTKI